LLRILLQLSLLAGFKQIKGNLKKLVENRKWITSDQLPIC